MAAAVLLILLGCPTFGGPGIDYRGEMRAFVQAISQYARLREADFLIIPQNGQELLTLSDDPDGSPAHSYLLAIDGVGREDLFFGYLDDDQPTPETERNYMVDYLQVARDNALAVLVTDYCWSPENIELSYESNYELGFIGFAAPSRNLDIIPDPNTSPVTIPFQGDSSGVSTLSEVRNFLYVLDPGEWDSRQEYLYQLDDADYDLLIIDAFDEDQNILELGEVLSLKTKFGGGERLVLAYMSIGEAEDYRYYWDPRWLLNPPSGWIRKTPTGRGTTR